MRWISGFPVKTDILNIEGAFEYESGVHVLFPKPTRKEEIIAVVGIEPGRVWVEDFFVIEFEPGIQGVYQDKTIMFRSK